MPANIINLNKARKARVRQARAETARVNRARHGRTKAELTEVETERKRGDAWLDGARLTPPEDQR